MLVATVIQCRCGSDLVDSICDFPTRINKLEPNIINYFHVLDCQHVVISFLLAIGFYFIFGLVTMMLYIVSFVILAMMHCIIFGLYLSCFNGYS